MQKRLTSRRSAARPAPKVSAGSLQYLPGLSLLCRLCLMACVLLFTGCQKGEVKPIEIAPEDMCAYCKMAMSERRYAAQFIGRDGQSFKFDDIGCMSNFIRGKQNRDQIAAYFVVDFDGRQWIKTEDAHYMTSPKLKSPMGGNTAAFKDEAKAQEAVAKLQGKLLRFEDILGQ